MEIKQVTHNHSLGFCNNLYYALHSYIYSTPDVKVIENLTDREVLSGIYDALCKVGCEEFISDKWNKPVFYESYLQQYNKDFTKEQLENFIKQHILTSTIYTNYEYNKEEKEKCLAVHIRNGDYLEEWNKGGLNCFDRKDYLYKAIHYPTLESFKELHVFSDDIGICIKQYGDIFKKKFQKVKYITYDDFLNDFVELSLYKNKILWNSTFSYWAAFISDVLYNHTGIILCPNKFTATEGAETKVPTFWTYIQVNEF